MNQIIPSVVRLPGLRWLAAASILFCAASTSVQAAKNDVTFKLGKIGSVIELNEELVIESGGAKTIFPSTNYRYNLNAVVQGKGGLLGDLVPKQVPLAKALATLGIGNVPLGGRVANESGKLPFDLSSKTIKSSIKIGSKKIPVSINFYTGILADGQLVLKVNFKSSGGGKGGIDPDDIGTLVFKKGSTLTVSTAPLVDFKAKGTGVAENAGSVKVVVRRQGSLQWPAAVTYNTVDGTAIAGVDYTAMTGTVSFAKGENLKEIEIPITNRLGVANSRKFTIQLSEPSEGTALGKTTVMSVLINRVAPTVP